MEGIIKDIPSGFIFNGLSCGIKKDGVLDIGIIHSKKACNYAGVFTSNSIKASPVKLCIERLGSQVRTVIVNSGNANALTGKQGMRDALSMATIAEDSLGGAKDGVCLSVSTGIIGQALPRRKVSKGILDLCKKVKERSNDVLLFSKSILTTDTKIKVKSKLINIGGKEVRLLGVAKGSGMIHPNMATMLAFIVTDLAISNELLQASLSRVVQDTFNAISVDGDESTNDSLILLANGMATNSPLKSEDTKDYLEYENALRQVCISLAIQIVEDGEGANKLIEVNLRGAKTKEDAKELINSFVRSPLVKTAFFGEDPNWGRFIAALGSSCAFVEEDKIELRLGVIKLFAAGEPLDFDENTARDYMKGKRITVNINLNLGKHSFKAYTCDLSDRYIEINSQYSS